MNGLGYMLKEENLILSFKLITSSMDGYVKFLD